MSLERVLIDKIGREDYLYSDGKTVFNPPTYVIRALDAALEYHCLLLCSDGKPRMWDSIEGWSM